MKQQANLPWFLVPPVLSMDEYAAFVSEAMSRADPEKVARQKAIEKRITVPFRLIPDGKEKASKLPKHQPV